MGATGLRLLNITKPKAVQNILEATRNAFANYGENWAFSSEFLSGRDEDIFGWISANLMAGNFGSNGQSSLLVGSLGMSEASSRKVSSRVSYEILFKGYYFGALLEIFSKY